MYIYMCIYIYMYTYFIFQVIDFSDGIGFD